MKYCENCKKGLPDNQFFCPECGSRLNDFVSAQGENDNQNGIVNAIRPEPTRKHCANCGKVFLGEQIYCPDCGTRLSDFTTNGKNSDVFTDTDRTPNNSLKYWLPVILAGVGAIVGFQFSGLLGFILGGCGLSLILKQKKEGKALQLPFILTLVLFIVDVIFWFMAMNA